MSLKNKKILITAGPTWVPIDKVRVLSNVATGKTGILLADGLQRAGAKVTLMLGPIEACCLNKKVRLLRFNFFNELKQLIIRELSSRKYDIVIHSAAVSDYKPKKNYTRKVKSGMRSWRLDLSPTPKIINLIKKLDRRLFLVGFKFEPGLKKVRLINKARGLIDRADLDLAVACNINHKGYRAYIVKDKEIYGPTSSRRKLAEELIKIIGGAYGTVKISG